MLVLQSGIRDPKLLAFSPNGQSLVIKGENSVQVWRNWLDAPPQPVFVTEHLLERLALSPDGSSLFQYLSGNSRTRVLKVATMRDTSFGLPKGPTWFHFNATSGFFLVSHGRGKLSRFDFAPKEKKQFRLKWTIDRKGPDEPDGRPNKLGSHYHFGDICSAANTFIALEHRHTRSEESDGLVVRSVIDGSLIHREVISRQEDEQLVNRAGLTLTIHPSGKFFAYPMSKTIRFRSLSSEPAPHEIFYAQRSLCHATTFHPSGTLLAAVGNDQLVKLYETTTGKIIREFAWDIGPLRAVCFSADGTRAATISRGSDRVGGKIVVWDVDL